MVDKFYQWTAEINIYDIYRTCWTVNQTDSIPLKAQENNFSVSLVQGKEKKYRKTFSTKDYTPWVHDPQFKHPLLGSGDCTWDSPITELFN